MGKVKSYMMDIEENVYDLKVLKRFPNQKIFLK